MRWSEDIKELIKAALAPAVIGQIEFTVKRISKTRILELEVRRLPR